MTSDVWNTPAMNNLEETERLKMDRKLLKPQVERRRRERMNRSLESLRVLLLQGPEAATQRRVEKAEILEHTVLFLQTSMAQAKKNQDSDEGSEGKRFMDGFSACLHKAARFLQTEEESRGLQGSLSASLYQHLSHPHVPTAGTVPTWVRIPTGTNVPQKKNQLPVACTQGLESARRNTHPYRVPARHTQPGGLVHHHGNTHATSQPTSGQQADVRQSVWRPWP
ncbi:hairy and enhancer of split related-7 [Colossoma macropomum]|uniref:hairy and enhancer of split related-7 n=1 Tax=Colossoma macropomum TaxID=42526 RepID=UPI00186562CC|nr:hairy and enhancer of split related-7 [Colossoma macropomum]